MMKDGIFQSSWYVHKGPAAPPLDGPDLNGFTQTGSIIDLGILAGPVGRNVYLEEFLVSSHKSQQGDAEKFLIVEVQAARMWWAT